MRRIWTAGTIAAVLVFSYGRAQAATTVKVNGTVDWTALTHFTNAQSGEVVFVDLTDFENLQFTVVPLTRLANNQARYSATLKASTPYFVAAVIADCASNPESCGTATTAGTHIRFNNFVIETPAGGPPITVDVVADVSLDPVAVCGNVSVQSGTYVKALAAAGPGGEEQFFSTGVFSTALVSAPVTSYCVQAARFSFTQFDSTVTIQQTQVPTCPAQLDVQQTDFLFLGDQPLTQNIVVVVPGAAGAISGTFQVNGFPHDFTQVFASTGGPTIGDCAGARFFSAGSGPGSPASFDVSPVLSGTWRLNATASRGLNTSDGLFNVIESSTAVTGDFVQVVVPPGGAAVAPLTFTAGVMAGNFVVDVRRWGAITEMLNAYPTFEGATNALAVVGAGWTPGLQAQPPMRISERYELNLDPRRTDWVLRAASGIGYRHSFPSANGSALSAFSVATMPNRVGPPFDQGGSLAVLVGGVTAGGTVSVDVPAADFRIATVTLNLPPGTASMFWSASRGEYTLPNGALAVPFPFANAFSFDGSPLVGHAKLPPGRYDGSTQATDADFNSVVDSRGLDLENDDDLTADFGAPALLAVRPIPGASGGSATVTGTVVTSAPPVQVTVNGSSATVANGSFSRATTIGTGPLTIVARDNLGRTTTLKRYFTTVAGLFAPAAGADLVSEGLDVNAIQNFTFRAPTPSSAFNTGRTIPLKLTGALGSAAVTGANAAAAPRVAAVLQVAPGVATTVNPTGGETVFRFDTKAAQWLCNLGTTGLTAGTYVVQIQFWDGRILEAAFVLA